MNQSKAYQNMITAFWNLYQQKNIEKITVRELCQTAGYHRATFYSHFDNIYDLLDKAIDELMKSAQPILIQLTDKGPKEDSFLHLFLELFQKNGFNIEALIQQHHQFILEEKIKLAIRTAFKDRFSQEVNSNRLDYILEYQLSAVLGMMTCWFQNHKNLSEQEFIKLIYQISSQGVFSLLYPAMS